jgi:hemerythrin-like metal-binding protein
MGFMTWTEDMSVGVFVLDNDHKKLIGIINQLHFGIMAGHKREILAAVLDHLVDYAKSHFAREEALLLRAKYPDSAEHKLDHERFVNEIALLRERFKSAPAAEIDQELMEFLSNWIVMHVQVSDKLYGPRLNARGIY